MKIALTNPGLIWVHDDNTVDEVYRVFGSKDNPAANLSTWISVDSLRRFMISEMHSEVMNRRDEWFKIVQMKLLSCGTFRKVASPQ